MRFEAGAEFAGYTIVSRLGRGGMATVYLAREAGLDRLVALKVLPEQEIDDREFAARFEQEARVVAGLDHPSIIPLYRYGITEGVPWMALRYVDGGDFGARLTARPLSVPEGLSILVGVAAALDYAHSKSVIHRDLKPQNILLTARGSAYLADFGIAKLLEGSAKLRTQTGGILGTPAYMSPEQAQGLQLGPYTDVYALAVICFQWLTGSLPFDADTPYAILIKHVNDPVPTQLLGQLSPQVAAVLLRGLTKQPAERFQAGGEFIAELEQALSSPVTRTSGRVNAVAAEPQSQPVSNPPSRIERPIAPHEESRRPAEVATGRGRRWALVGAMVLVLGLGIGAYAYWRIALQPAAGRDTSAAQAIPNPAAPAPEQVQALEGQVEEDKRAAQERPAEAAAASQGTLIVKADADCKLTVNGDAKGALSANESKSVTVSAGEQLVECTSSEAGGGRAQETKSVGAGAEAVVVLKLPRAEPALSPQPARRFVQQGGGVLKDHQTGLDWTQSDNGSDIGWNDARSYCASRGSGWRLASRNELSGIYDKSGSMRTSCGEGFTCKVSPLFHLSSDMFWTGDADGPSLVFGLNLATRNRFSATLDAAAVMRALCVHAAADKQATEQAATDKGAAQERAMAAQGTLVVKADADCKLTVNGEAKGALLAEQTRSLKVSAGEQLIECASSEAGGGRAHKTKSLAAGAQMVVVLNLPRAKPEPPPQPASRFVEQGGGVLKDNHTGLEWTQSDNGNDIDWSGARTYCASRGGSWRLPSPDELITIYDANVPSPQVCGTVSGAISTATVYCKVSHLFHLTGTTHWSGKSNGLSEAFYVRFQDGGSNTLSADYSPYARALCVRRP